MKKKRFRARGDPMPQQQQPQQHPPGGKPAPSPRDSLMQIWVRGMEGTILPHGYRRLSEVAEIEAAALRIASLVASMTIQLMENGEGGHVRIQNGLSRLVDITPNPWTTRFNFIQRHVLNMLLDGNSYSLVVTKGGYIDKLDYMEPAQVSLRREPDGGYRIIYAGREIDPGKVLHFVHNPDPRDIWRGTGLKVPLSVLAGNLRQAQATRTAYLRNKHSPALIISVDAYNRSFASPEARKEILKDYVETSEIGEPWVVPAGEMKVEQVKPLSIKDLAIPESMSIDRKTVAAIFGIPSFVLGEGEYSRYEWNCFINSTVRPLAIGIQQELTRKLIVSSSWFFRFNPGNLYDYEPGTMATVLQNLHDRGAATGDELRHSVGLDPAGLTEFRALENYIPYDSAGSQKKLGGNGNGGKNENA